jgi:hypothetical protein
LGRCGGLGQGPKASSGLAVQVCWCASKLQVMHVILRFVHRGVQAMCQGGGVRLCWLCCCLLFSLACWRAQGSLWWWGGLGWMWVHLAAWGPPAPMVVVVVVCSLRCGVLPHPPQKASASLGYHWCRWCRLCLLCLWTGLQNDAACRREVAVSSLHAAPVPCHVAEGCSLVL